MRLAEHGAMKEARALLRQAAEKAGDERRLQGLIHNRLATSLL